MNLNGLTHVKRGVNPLRVHTKMYMRGSTRKVQNGVSKQTRFSNNRLLTGMASQAADSVTKQHYHSPGLKLANSGILPKENKRPVTALVTQELLADMKVV